MRTITRNALVAVALVGCSDRPEPTSREALESATFLTQAAEGGTISLSEGQAVDPGSGIQFSLLTTTEGDIDLDGQTDAVAVVVEQGPRAAILQLHAFVREDDEARDVAARMIGDRLTVRRITIEDGVIGVGLLVRRHGEPVTIDPSVRVTHYFALTENGITPVAHARVEAETDAAGTTVNEPPSLHSHEWHLRAFETSDWAADLAVLERTPSVRFVVDGLDPMAAWGKLAGFAGCNRVFARFRAEGDGLQVAGVGSTRRACEGAPMDFERRFLAAFDEVDVFEVSESRLTLRFDGGELVFEAGGRLLPPEEATTAPSDGSDARADGADGTSAAL